MNKNIFKNKGIIVTIILLTIFLSLSFVSLGEDTESDPLVTLSYVEKRIEEMKDYINLKVSDNSTGVTASFKIENPKEGSTIYFTKESTEVILRAGKGLAIASENGGLADLTAGIDLKTDDNVPLNHHLLIPRDDGRGIKIVEDSWIMIKGDYEIK